MENGLRTYRIVSPKTKACCGSDHIICFTWGIKVENGLRTDTPKIKLCCGSDSEEEHVVRKQGKHRFECFFSVFYLIPACCYEHHIYSKVKVFSRRQSETWRSESIIENWTTAYLTIVFVRRAKAAIIFFRSNHLIECSVCNSTLDDTKIQNFEIYGYHR